MLKYFALLWCVSAAVLNAQEYKAVFDCSSDDARYIHSRISLVEKTLQLIEEQGGKATFAITVHGGCFPIVSRNYDEFVANEDILYIQKAQEAMKRLSEEKNVEIVACAMSLKANDVDTREVLPFIRLSKDSFIDTIGYQNKGYAVMTFK